MSKIDGRSKRRYLDAISKSMRNDSNFKRLNRDWKSLSTLERISLIKQILNVASGQRSQRPLARLLYRHIKDESGLRYYLRKPREDKASSFGSHLNNDDCERVFRALRGRIDAAGGSSGGKIRLLKDISALLELKVDAKSAPKSESTDSRVQLNDETANISNWLFEMLNQKDALWAVGKLIDY